MRRKPLRGSLGEAIAEWNWKRGLALRAERSAVFRAFERAVGEQVAARARAVAWRRGVLLVEVASASHFHELKNFTHDACLARVNGVLGSPRVKRIEFRVGGRRQERG